MYTYTFLNNDNIYEYICFTIDNLFHNLCLLFNEYYDKLGTIKILICIGK